MCVTEYNDHDHFHSLTFIIAKSPIMSDKKGDLTHPGRYFSLSLLSALSLPIVGYNPGEQHLGKAKIDSQEDTLPPQAGTHGQPESHVSGQGGPEIMGGP